MTDDQIRKALQELCKAPIINKVATIVSVDEANYTAIVLPEGEAELEVRLKAGIDGIVDGMVEIPTVDSDVLISLLGNDPDTAYIAKCSKVEKVVFFGGENHGIVKIEPLIEKINNLETQQNQILTALKAITIQLAPTGTIPFAPIFASILPITNTAQLELENLKITH